MRIYLNSRARSLNTVWSYRGQTRHFQDSLASATEDRNQIQTLLTALANERDIALKEYGLALVMIENLERKAADDGMNLSRMNKKYDDQCNSMTGSELHDILIRTECMLS
jgi:hypothetical protein